MKLSIITINYNNLSGLRKTVDSVLAQTWRDFEWIIIDGGSTDGSKELIEEIAARPDSQIAYWCSEPDKGIYNAMNKGICHAYGEYVQFLNSGDCLFSAKILQEVFSKKYDSDIIYGRCAFGNTEEFVIPEMPTIITFAYLLRKSLCHPSTFIKRSLLFRNPYDEKYRIVSDWKNWVIWKIEGRSFEFVNNIISLFDTTGLSSKNDNIIKEETGSVLKELLPDYVYELSNDYVSFYEKYEIDNSVSELQMTYRYIHCRRLYKRIIRGTLSVISMLEKIRR